ncbi:MAG: hypothetical protein PHT00_01200 [Candidatus Methanomethylophilus sp.]|nr:hypothetical protein [Methanomethylophilus sp.]MDD4222223.1 hypothetical protein [Methanomethylophilus sp.]MDD4668456.1 hypothetical protein [Methanomethylophilus sp.]
MAVHSTKMESWGSFTEGQWPIFAGSAFNRIGTVHWMAAAQAAMRFPI